jgi:hypothetical protein
MCDTLLAAIEAGAVDAVRQVLRRDPGLAGARDEPGTSAVLAALYRQRQEIVSGLLDAHPQVDTLDAAALGVVDRLAHLLDVERTLVNAHAADGFSILSRWPPSSGNRPPCNSSSNEGRRRRHVPQPHAAAGAALGGCWSEREAVRLLLEAGARPKRPSARRLDTADGGGCPRGTLR